MIFAAGLGSRLKPLTDKLPKALVPIAGKTLLQWQIEKLKAAGITDIVVNVHHFPDLIINYLQEHNNFGCNIQVSDERERLLETGGGLRKAKEAIWQLGEEAKDEGILVCNVDILSNIDIPTLLETYNPKEMGIVVVSDRQTQRYLLFDEDNRLCGWTNNSTGEIRGNEAIRRKGDIAIKRLAFSGMQVLSPRIFECMNDVVEEKGEKFSLIDLYVNIADKEVLRAYVPNNYCMMDVGKIDQISKAETFAQTISIS